jgi:hypothetical protein
MIVRPVTRPLSGWSVNKMVVPTDYLETCLPDLVLGYRSSDLVSLNLDFARLFLVIARSTIKDDEPSA